MTSTSMDMGNGYTTKPISTETQSNSNFVSKSINLTDYINTYDDLENFKVRIEASQQQMRVRRKR